MTSATQANRRVLPYASPADFCRIFKSDMNRLYLLSLLLTGDSALAEKCFVSGLEEARTGSHVFREWAESWARRTVVQNAIRMIRPRPNDVLANQAVEGQPEIAAIQALAPFERFVFVMTVLERYTDQECSLLLDCSRSEVAAARSRALQQIGSSAELSRRVVGSDSFEPALTPASTLKLRLDAISHMAASA